VWQLRDCDLVTFEKLTANI